MNDAPSANLVRVAAAGDSALVAGFPNRIDPEINDRASALAQRLRWRWGGILRDVVVGYCTVTVYFDPLRVDAPWLESEIRAAAGPARQAVRAGKAVVDVPVCYEGDLAPDLADVAAFGRCSTEEVVALHTGRPYRVYMVGFIPGFAYLAEVDSRIAAPRRATPRTAVPAGRGRDRRGPDRNLSGGDPWWLEHHRSHLAQALRSGPPESVPLRGGR